MNTLEYGKGPESPVAKFEKKLQEGITSLKEKKENLSHWDLKNFVRFFCAKEVEKMGLPPEYAAAMAPYFFRFLYEDTENTAQLWELLYNLSQNSNNPEVAEESFDKIFSINNGGTNSMWNVVNGILKGNFSIGATGIGDEKVFYIAGQKEPAPDGLAQRLEGNIKTEIKQKPVMNPDEEALGMTQQERDLFFKILDFMENDSEAIINSGTWHCVIEKYFKGVTIHLLSTIKILNVPGTKSDARKKRYKNFVVSVMQNHIRPLRDYCLEIAGKKDERNRFANDFLFEQYLISNNILVNGYQEPSYEAIEKKWDRLFFEMKSHIEDNATLWGLRAMDILSEQQAPKSVDDLREESSDALTKTIMGMPAIPEIPKIPDHDKKAIERADTIVMAINDELKRAAQSQPPQTMQPKKDKRLSSSAMLVYPYIGVAPGTDAERDLLKAIRQDVTTIFKENEEGIKNTPYCDSFVRKLTDIARNRASTQDSMKEFLSSVVFVYKRLADTSKDSERDCVFENISVLFDSIGSGLHIPKNILANLKDSDSSKKQTNTGMPQLTDVKLTVAEFPSIDSPEFENLKNFMIEKGIYERFREIELDFTQEIVASDVKNLRTFEELNKRLSLAVSQAEGFAYYHNQKAELTDNAIAEIKKLTGNWFTKHFKFGRSKQVKEELKTYSEKLETGVSNTWKLLLRPMILQYGKIIFGSDLYAQKT